MLQEKNGRRVVEHSSQQAPFYTSMLNASVSIVGGFQGIETLEYRQDASP